MKSMLKSLSVPIVFGLGLIALITTLALATNSVRERELTEMLTITDELLDMEEERSWFTRQQEYNYIQLRNPGLSEYELLLLPETQELLEGGGMSHTRTEINDFTPVNFPVFNLPRSGSPETPLSQLELILGFLRFGTNIDENYAALLRELPVVLGRHMILSDITEGDYIRLFTRIINEYHAMVVLTRKDLLETHIFLVESGEYEENGVFNITVLENSEVFDVILLDSHVLLNTSNAYYTQSALVLIGNKDGVPAVMSHITADGLFFVYQHGSLVSVINSDIVFEFEVADYSNIVLTAINGDTKVGVIHD